MGVRHWKTIHSEIVRCGDCCLIHQQFTREVDIHPEEEGAITVFRANEYQPSCVPGSNGGDTEGTFTLPFGSLLVANEGDNPFDIELLFDEGFQETILPGAQFAYTGMIRRVNILFPVDPIRALFDFDLFLAPPDPV